MIIYNLFPLLAGPVTQWEAHLNRAADMGFNWIFVNPIQQTGSSGSLYAVKDYFAFNPALIDPEKDIPPVDQVKQMISTAKRLGLNLMVDLVINHCSVDSALLDTHPEWLMWEKRGRVAHPYCDENGKRVVWKDLAKFDHKNSPDKEGLFKYFLEVVFFLVSLGFKGFRCDAAYQVPKSLWKRLIRETKKRHPGVVFFAETLGCPPDQTTETARAGFDYIFNSSKWWDFKSHWLMKQYALTREIAPSISFPESHDTERLCRELDGNVAGLKQRYFFSAVFSAGVMMPVGFEYGFKKRLHVVKTTPKDWEKTDIDLTPFITRVNRIKAQHPVFQEDAPTEILTHDNRNVLLMWKGSVSTREEALIIVNKDIDHRQEVFIENLRDLVQAGAPLSDLSPEGPMQYIPAPFSYDLAPGQLIVLATTRDAVETD
ncbi:MAG: alpha-amylase [Deltaproteobacteria bacterium]|nr:alpha-amylase [Deltaproteobacteria bacterium]